MVDDDSFNSTVRSQITNTNLINFTLEWSITKFGDLMKLVPNRKHMASRRFSTKPYETDIVWQLLVFPNGCRREYAKHVSIFVYQVGKLRKGPIKAKINFSFHSIPCNSPNSFTIPSMVKRFVYGRNCYGYGRCRLPHTQFTNLLNADGDLIIICSLTYLDPNFPLGEFNIKDEEEEGLSLKKLLDSSLLSDFVIKVGDERFNCHKCILASHSAVFQRMLEHTNTKEAQHGIIDIVDSSCVAMKGLLEFMYTGGVTNLHECAQELLAVAEKYDIPKCKKLCEQQLICDITAVNICHLLIFADLHSATLLKQACMKFLLENHRRVMETNQWKLLHESNPRLTGDISEWILNGGKDVLAIVSSATNINLALTEETSQTCCVIC